jgi:hypothetical protein
MQQRPNPGQALMAGLKINKTEKVLALLRPDLARAVRDVAQRQMTSASAVMGQALVCYLAEIGYFDRSERV